MNSKLLTVVGVGAVALAMNTGESSAMEHNQGTVTASVLNVRSGPGTDNAVIGKATKGSLLKIMETSSGWHKVKLSDGKEGWVSGNYVKITSTDKSTEGVISVNIINKGKVTARALNVRSGVGTHNSIVGKLTSGMLVDITDQSSGWYKVTMPNGTVGWCSGQYIQGVDSSIVTVPNVSIEAQKPAEVYNVSKLDGVKGRVATNSLNVRGGVGTKYSIIGTLDGDTVVDLLEESSGWYKVKASNGNIGWCSGSYIKVLSESETNNNIDVKPSANIGSNDANSVQEAIVNVAKSQLGKPYAWGAEGPNSFDCSGFTSYVYKQATGKSIPRVSKDQARFGTYVSNGNYQPGDLIYLDTEGGGSVTHVGIYIGDGQMIHASGSKSKPDKVKISSIVSGYYSNRVLGARRF